MTDHDPNEQEPGSAAETGEDSVASPDPSENVEESGAGYGNHSDTGSNAAGAGGNGQVGVSGGMGDSDNG